MPDVSCCCVQAPEYARLPVPEGSPEWTRVLNKLHQSLPGATLTGLERVQNQYTWRQFYHQLMSGHKADGAGHIDFTQPDSIVKELWHATGAVDAICKSKIG